MPEFTTIVTHPGSAHTDEFLACCVLLTQHATPIVRREPTAADVATATTCVVDVGHRHEPALNNFDHHQLPKDYPPTCALSLVLQHLGLYDDARQFCDWLETTERFDTRGPFDTAQWLGTTPETLARLNSPITTSVLRRFAKATQLNAGDPVWELMRTIGTDLVDYVRSVRARLDYLAQHTEVWALPLGGGAAQVLFLPRTEPPLEDPSFAIDRYIHSRGLADQVVAIVSPDRRGIGYGLERYRDNARVDFTRIAHHSGVHFAHARGFVAKTSLTTKPELQALVAAAVV